MLDVSIVKSNDKSLKLSDTVKNKITNIVSWNEEPVFLTEGRVSWYILDKPIFSLDMKHKFHAIKFKGIGVCNRTGRNKKEITEKPIPPTTDVFKRSSAHFGLNCKGKIEYKFSEDAPYGGMLLERALNDFENMDILFNKGVRATVPGSVYLIRNKTFCDKLMGVSVSFSYSDIPYRLMKLIWEDRYIDAKELSFFEEIKKRNKIEGNFSSGKTKLQVSCCIAFQYGKLIRNFSEAGLFIHSGGWDNLQYDLDNNFVYLTDLDSSKKMEDIPAETRALQATRDLVSTIYRFLNKLYHPKAVKLYSSALFFEYDVINNILNGYMPENDTDILRNKSSLIWNYYIKYFDNFKMIESEVINLSKSKRSQLKMDKYDFYAFCMDTLYSEVLKTNSNFVFQNSISVKEFGMNYKEYLRERLQT